MFLLKLGGSLITDKTCESAPRPDVIRRVAGEISAWWSAQDSHARLLLVGHGSGSFGHAAAQRYGTRAGVHGAEGWWGFAEVSVIAARLNRIVADALHEAGLPVMSFCPSASARCRDGRLVYLDTTPIRTALDNGLLPLVMGDVAFDAVRGGTIVSTEEVFAYLVRELPVTHVLLAGETEGVYRRFPPAGESDEVIERITPQEWESLHMGVGSARGADVTGGMAAKVRDMLALVTAHPTVTVRIFSGLVAGNVLLALRHERLGTEIVATDDARLIGPVAA